MSRRNRWDLKVDQKRNNDIIDEHIICLTDTEYKILKLFIKYPTKIYSVENIYESVWEEPYIYSSSNTVMVHIKNLRNKLSQNGYDYAKIKTVWGKGYCFERQV